MQRANKTKHTARQVDHVTHALHNAPAQASSTHHPYTHTYCSHPVMLAHQPPPLHTLAFFSFIELHIHLFHLVRSGYLWLQHKHTNNTAPRSGGGQPAAAGRQGTRRGGVSAGQPAPLPLPCPVSGGGDDVMVVVLVGGRRFLEIFIIQFPMSVGNGRIHLLAAASEKGTTGQRRRDKR